MGGGCTGGVPVCQRPCGPSPHPFHAHSPSNVEPDKTCPFNARSVLEVDDDSCVSYVVYILNA